MDPPNRSHSKRRVASIQTSQEPASPKFVPDTSPSPFTSNGKMLQHSVETRRPRSSHTVSLGWEDAEDAVQRTSRLQVELADCIETKTVTTTTTTKRSYPPLLFQSPRSLDSLDAKEYPLALKPTPPELAKFSYEVNGQRIDFGEDDFRSVVRENAKSSPLSKSYLPFPDQVEADKRDRSSKQDGAMNDTKKALKTISPSNHRHRSPIQSASRPSSSKISELRKGHSRDPLQESRRRNLALGISLSDLPATPDMSEVESSGEFPRPQASRLFASSYTPQSGLSQNDSFEDPASPSQAATRETFNSAVATPPVAESDLELSEIPDTNFIEGQRPHVNTAVAQNASLPSPGLSPTFTAAELQADDMFPSAPTGFDNIDDVVSSPADSQDIDEFALRALKSRAANMKLRRPSAGIHAQYSTVMEIGSMLETFDSMPNELKTLMMYQLSRRCSKKTLRAVANFVNPALKCDFLDELPTELSLHILSYLDHRDLCRAAQVSKRWRNVIDSNETGWKELFDRDGFVLQAGELERAIHQGWAWQDPYGPDGYEMDLSVKDTTKSVDGESSVAGSSRNDSTRRPRIVSKRKRPTVSTGSERVKRRATGNDFSARAQELVAKYPHTARYHKSEGPMSAASAAALAVPDPQIGLPELRKLHLFKSLYRRHYFLRHSWTNRRVEPHHMAFKAHPAHVITCLQFDDEKILTGSDDTCIHVYDTKTGALRKKLEGHDGGVWALQYEGNVLVSGSTDRSVRVWDIEKGLCTQVFHGHTSTVRCLQILMPTEAGRTMSGKPIMVPEKPLIITGSRDSQLRVWRLPEQGDKRYIQTGPPANDADCPYFVRVLAGHTHSVRAIAAHQDTLVSGSYDSSVRVWKISTGEVLHRLLGHSAKVYSVVLDHKRNRCISGSMDTFVRVWSLETGSCLFSLEGHTSLVGLLDLRDDRLVSAAADSTLRIWDPESGVCKSTLSAHTGAITCFQHDGQKVISGSDRTLKMWDVKTGECIKDLLADLSGVWQVKFDERRCVAAVQRDNFTYVEVLDFGASRDGVPASERGHRILLPGNDETDRIVAVDDDVAG
ncbi:hypothetical protein CJF32_00003439 [Rutstroemia sp. NJR-2017a WRK4]|nr:hypothetical protein CJF32_00003439 [Rutstroemia sp. NJR-2017a WRK4]